MGSIHIPVFNKAKKNKSKSEEAFKSIYGVYPSENELKQFEMNSSKFGYAKQKEEE